MKNQKIGVVIQARMGSTRLPGKVLKKLYKEDSVLDILIKRLKLCNELDKIIIATTPNKKNQPIINTAKSHNILWFIGNEENVLERYYQTATEFNLNIVVRVTSDNPFTDPNIIDDMTIFYKTHKLDHIRCLDENFNTPVGFGVEVFSYETLKKAYTLANTKIEKEHVTYFIYKNPNRFSCSYYIIKNLKIIDDFRLTIDYYEDLIVCREVFKKLMEKKKSIDFSIFDVLEIIEENNEILEINKYVKKRPIR